MTAGREAAAEGAAACGPPPVPPGPVALPACCDPLSAAATCCCLRCRPGPPLTKLKSPDMGAFRVPGGGDGLSAAVSAPPRQKNGLQGAQPRSCLTSRYTCTFWTVLIAGAGPAPQNAITPDSSRCGVGGEAQHRLKVLAKGTAAKNQLIERSWEAAWRPTGSNSCSRHRITTMTVAWTR